jgi:putative chitinase
MGNGNEIPAMDSSLEGVVSFSLGGRSNYVAASNILGVNLVKRPDDLLIPKIAALSAAWFWASHGLNALADDKTDDNDLRTSPQSPKELTEGLQG